MSNDHLQDESASRAEDRALSDRARPGEDRALSDPARLACVSARLARLGWVPLLLAVANGIENWQRLIPHNVLWLCHVSDATLGLGLLLRRPTLVRLATLNLIAGCLLWIRYSTFINQATWVSALGHLGGAAVGLFAMRTVRASRRAWIHAFLFMVALQVVCYLYTPQFYNVNLSHRFFTALLGKPVALGEPRWQSFGIETAYGVGLFLINRLLLDAFPAEDREKPAEPAPPSASPEV